MPRLAFDPVAKLDAIETECLHIIFRCDIAMAPGFAGTRLVLIITELWHVAHGNEFFFEFVVVFLHIGFGLAVIGKDVTVNRFRELDEPAFSYLSPESFIGVDRLEMYLIFLFFLVLLIVLHEVLLFFIVAHEQDFFQGRDKLLYRFAILCDGNISSAGLTTIPNGVI